MNKLQSKLGPLKVWQWGLIGAALGVAILIYKKGHGEAPAEGSGELFGGTGTGAYGAIDPETGVPYQFEGGGGGGVANPTESLDSFLERVGMLKEQGFFPESEKVVETVVNAGAENQAAKSGQAKKKRQKPKAPATSTGAGAAAGGAGHTTAPHPANRIGIAQNRPVSGPVKLPGAVTGGGGGVAQVGGVGGASGGQIHPQAFSSGIGAGHPKPAAPPGYHAYKGNNGQWWFAPNS